MARPTTPGFCRDCGEHRPTLNRDRCPNCYMHWWNQQKASVLARMQAKMAPQPNGCIHWTGRISKEGYGYVGVKGTTKPTHRVAYELHVGPIPEGIWIDHACHNGDMSCLGGSTCLHRRCVNPQHLEPVTPRENQHRSHLTDASKTACVHGHPFTAENTYLRPDGKGRCCRECIRAREKQRERKKSPRPPAEACKRGHRFTAENTYMYGNSRHCRECRRECDRQRYWREKHEGSA